MTENLYAPPLSEPAPPVKDANDSPPFYIVATRKFWILLLSTVGTYQIYWFYRHWKAQKAATGERMWPLMRAIFVVFFTHSLFRRIDQANDAGRHPLSIHATVFVLLTILDSVVSRMARKDVGSPWTDLSELLLVPILGIFMAMAQTHANRACGDPEGSLNDDLTGANAFWILMGFILWGVIAFGLLTYTGVISLEEA